MWGSDWMGFKSHVVLQSDPHRCNVSGLGLCTFVTVVLTNSLFLYQFTSCMPWRHDLRWTHSCRKMFNMYARVHPWLWSHMASLRNVCFLQCRVRNAGCSLHGLDPVRVCYCSILYSVHLMYWTLTDIMEAQMSTSNAHFLFLLISLIYLPFFMLLHEESSCFLFIYFFCLRSPSHAIFSGHFRLSDSPTYRSYTEIPCVKTLLSKSISWTHIFSVSLWFVWFSIPRPERFDSSYNTGLENVAFMW